MSEFSIKSIFERSFGYEPPADFTIKKAEDRIERSELGTAYYQADDMQREHFMPVTLGDVLTAGSGFLGLTAGTGLLLPFAVVSITPRKIIVSTPMVERKGSVHEIISIDDYSINIKGLFIGKDNNYPEKYVTMLERLFQENKSIPIKCAKTDIFLKGEDKVVIKDISLPATPGVQHVQPFEINCVSDTIFTLEQ